MKKVEETLILIEYGFLNFKTVLVIFLNFSMYLIKMYY